VEALYFQDIVATLPCPHALLILMMDGERKDSGMAGVKVFVVDDEQPIADILSAFLREYHYDVETFYDAHSVLKRADQCLPDVLVTDITMPGMTGIALAEAVRQRRDDCKVILISGNPEWRCREELQRIGNKFVLLLKPFRVSQLLHLVKPAAAAA
jgi:DNA-binding NtrC family response regulator